MLAEAGAEVRGASRRGPDRLDVTDRKAVGRYVASLPRIDGLLLAAGDNIPRRRLEELTPESWDQLLAVNLSGAFYVLRAALPKLRESQGSVIVVSSVSGQWPDVSGPAYQAAKAGAIALVRAAALEELGSGVRYSTILPGVVDTPILDKRPQPPGPEIRARMLKPEDVAAACLFLFQLPAHVTVPELTILPAQLQALGHSSASQPPPAPAR
jgi:NAD(P)-dependent dehydrogenase (short-subunit alcohol dehydrogenase family)